MRPRLAAKLLIPITAFLISVPPVGAEPFVSAAKKPSTTVSASAKQKILSKIFTGECVKNRGYPGQVVMEEKYGPTCRVTVTLSGATARTVTLQYWSDDDNKWYEESRKKTKKGKAAINFNAKNCGDNSDEYCDGTYEYRIVVLPLTKPKLGAIKSDSFDVLFIALDSTDEEECDPYYDEC